MLRCVFSQRLKVGLPDSGRSFVPNGSSGKTLGMSTDISSAGRNTKKIMTC